MPDTRPSNSRTNARIRQPSGCLPLAVLLGLLLAAVALHRASGHERDAPDAQYYGSLHTADGGSCCGGPGSPSHDCAPTEARLGPVGWEALYRGHWLAIPPEIIRHVANPTGQPTLCVYQNVMRCFVPASET